VANGRVASMCAGRVSMVLALAAAVRAIGLDSAAHHLDGEHYPHVYRLASTHPWTSVCTSWVDYVVGIWIRRNDRCDYPVAPDHATGRDAGLKRLAVDLGYANKIPRRTKERQR